jgi:D-alanyl-lipoteichoic acid acyltransferase DltB (MBOAT superfamily)
MENASLQFVCFGLAVAVIVNLGRRAVWRSAVLLLASFGFIACIDRNPVSLLPLAGFLLLGYVCMVVLQGRGSRQLGWILACVILVYFWLKKYTILPEATFIHTPYLVLGMSYIFFRVLHLLIEAREFGNSRRVSFFAYLLYTLNFTTFISGPIQRYDEFARDQFTDDPIPLDARVVGLQLERILRGMFKVNVVAMLLSMYRVDALSQVAGPGPAWFKVWALLRLSLLYPLFLYANFSGYIDIVIALARLIRLRLPENFDRPFAASSFLDFWNHWHMTLSGWLKTYVYNPLLLFLMRRFPSPGLDPFLGVISFFVTFFLIGVWHGRTSEFIVFGVLSGGGVSINKLWQIGLTKVLGRKRYKALSDDPLYEAFGRGLNFVWFSFILFWFWGGWKQIDSVFSSLTVTELVVAFLFAWLGATAGFGLWERLRGAFLSLKTGEEAMLTSRYARMVYASVFGLVVLVFTLLLNQSAPEIVYRAF